MVEKNIETLQALKELTDEHGLGGYMSSAIVAKRISLTRVASASDDGSLTVMDMDREKSRIEMDVEPSLGEYVESGLVQRCGFYSCLRGSNPSDTLEHGYRLNPERMPEITLALVK